MANHRIPALVSCAVAAALLPIEARAQQGESESGRLDEVVVTAQKREQRLQDVPIAVSVVSGALAESTGGFNVEGLRTLVPSLNIRKTNTSLLTLAIPLCTALMAVHCIVPPHPAALYVTNQLGADVGSVIVYGLAVGLFASLVGGPLFLKLLGNRLPFKEVPAAFADIKARDEATLPTLSASLFTVLLPILLMLAKTVAELNMEHASHLYTVLEFIGNPITAMFIAAFTAYYVLGIRQQMKMEGLLNKTEECFSSIANILLIIGAGGAFNGVLKASGLGDSLATILSQLDMHPILLAWLVAIVLHAAVGSATVAMMGATAIVSPIMVHYPNISPEIMTLAIGSGAIGCTMVTDSLFWLVKQYCGATLNETLKYYTTATLVASLMALAGTFLLSYIV